MTSHSWENLSRVLLCMILGFVVFITLITLRHGGFLVATDLSDMVPSGASSPARRAVVNAATKTAEQSVILILESPDPIMLNQALASVDEKLATMSEWLHRQNMASLEDLVATRLSAYRFHLLTPEDNDTLASGNLDAVLEQALTDLYSPSGSLRLLPLQKDPFNFFGHYLEAGIVNAAFTSSVTQSFDNEDSEITDPVFRETISLRLKTAISELQEQAALQEFFTTLDTVLESEYPQVTLLRTGVLFFSNEAATAAKRDINFISIGSAIGMTVLILLVFRSVRPLLTAVISVFIGVGFALTVVHLLYGSVHVFTIVFGASLIGIVIDYSIHYHYHCATSAVKKSDHSQLHRALFISLVTSIAGFSALLFSSVLMLQKIAVFSICGISAAWLTVLALAPGNPSGSMAVRQRLVNPIADVLVTVGGQCIERLERKLAMLVLGIILACAVVFGNGQDDPRRFVNLSEDLLQQSAEIRTIINDLEPGKFFIVEAANEQLLFDRLDQLYASIGESMRLVSVRNWLPSPSEQQRNYLVQAPLFQDSGPIEQFFTATGGEEQWLALLRSDYIRSADKPLSSQKFFELLKQHMSPMVLSIENTAENTTSLAAFVLLGTGSELDNVNMQTAAIQGISYVDTVADSTTQLRHQRLSSMWILVLAYVVVGSLMWLVYRDRRALLMTSVPAVSTILTLGTLLLLGQPLTLFHTMALFLILGLGMDYVVFLNEMTADHKITRQAIVLSGLTSMLSFGLLAMSSVPVAQGFGLTILIGNSYNLLMTLGMAESKRWQSAIPR